MLPTYSDTTILTRGEYPYTKLAEIPSRYLLRIYNLSDKSDESLYNYIAENLEAIKKREGKPISRSAICLKACYLDESSAKRRLSEIIRGSVQRQKTPVRAYKCDICELWHLTSKPMEGLKPMPRYNRSKANERFNRQVQRYGRF